MAAGGALGATLRSASRAATFATPPRSTLRARPLLPPPSLYEQHGRPLFCLKFNTVDPAYKDLLATAGANKASRGAGSKQQHPHVRNASSTAARGGSSFCLIGLCLVACVSAAQTLCSCCTNSSSRHALLNPPQATVYQCRPGGQVDVLQCYTDADVSCVFLYLLNVTQHGAAGWLGAVQVPLWQG